MVQVTGRPQKRDCSMIRNVVPKLVSSVLCVLHSDIWAQFPYYLEPRLGPTKLKRQLSTDSKKSVTGLLTAFSVLFLTVCLLALQRALI